MSTLLNTVDPDGLIEYSVVYTDRSLNHMSKAFQRVMRGISSSMKRIYNAHAVAVVPGGGTFGMEAVARQFATGQKCLVVRNGLFSYRWSQIFEMGQIPSEHSAIKASSASSQQHSPFAPPPVDEVIARIKSEKPNLVFAPHVETSSGIILPNNYIKSIAEAVHSVGGMMVLDCIASGSILIDMQKNGIDILISAPQKGWDGPACAGIVMLSPQALDRIDSTVSSSFACDLKKWLQIMQAYENNGHAYHATMPTDALATFYENVQKMEAIGLEHLYQQQLDLGRRIRATLAEKGIVSVAGNGFQAPSVVVSFTDNKNIHNGKHFAEAGMQIAAGVPLFCDEPEGFQTFRLGLFGLDKLQNVDRTVDLFEQALDKVFAER